ncbi:MAG: hypothetical protein ACI83O_000587 [Patescibacteria group bacterium]|jgi:hypothetical protein
MTVSDETNSAIKEYEQKKKDGSIETISLENL